MTDRPHGHAGTPIARLVAVEGRRWAIEDAVETAKNELGLDRNETRSWLGWHRHVSLVMLAFAMMAAVRHRANTMAPPNDTQGSPRRFLIRWSVQEIRRMAKRLAQRRIRPAHVIVWSVRRRAHQAAAQLAHVKRRSQL
jgi:SRSO17 transposase